MNMSFSRTPAQVAACLSSIALFSHGLLYTTAAAADESVITPDTVAELKAENARLRQALDAARQQLAAQHADAPSIPSATNLAASVAPADAGAAPAESPE